MLFTPPEQSADENIIKLVASTIGPCSPPPRAACSYGAHLTAAHLPSDGHSRAEPERARL